VTHDKDWCALIEEVGKSDCNKCCLAHPSGKADKKFPSENELLHRVRRKYTPVLESGIPHYLIDITDAYILSGFVTLIPQGIPNVGSQNTSLKLNPLTIELWSSLLFVIYHRSAQKMPHHLRYHPVIRWSLVPQRFHYMNFDSRISLMTLTSPCCTSKWLACHGGLATRLHLG